MEENKHTLRMALAMTALVAVLFVIAVGQFTGGGAEEQQASVLRAYAE